MTWDWLLYWPPRKLKTLCLLTVASGICWLFLLGCLSKIWNDYAHSPYHSFGDFFPLWSYARIASTHAVTDLYDFNLIHTHQVALGMDPALTNPFPYAPISLLILWPLDRLPYEISYIVWMMATLGLFVWAIIATCSRSRLWLLGIPIAPAVAYNIYAGQSGFLTGALMIAGIRLAEDRRISSGIFLGILLSFKPQIALLVPLAYVARRNWIGLAVSFTTILTAAVVATVIFGWAVWPAWVSQLPIYSVWFDHQIVLYANIMPTLTANLTMVGIPSTVVQVAQLSVATVVAALSYICLRRGPAELSAAALLVGTFLATPHAVMYDTPILVAASILFIEWCLKRAPMLNLIDIICVLLMLLLPIFMIFSMPINSMVLLLMFCRILMLVFAETRSSRLQHRVGTPAAIGVI